MRQAGLSIDVDSVASHLEGYGFERPGDSGEAYTLAVPRFLELLDRRRARATFFLIASEAAPHPESVREIVSRGHEVACHSLTHPVPFTALSDEQLDREVRESKEVLEAVGQTEVIGFRAPSFGMDARVLSRLVRAGYLYDASSYPSPLLPLMRRAIRARAASRDDAVAHESGWREVLRPTRIHFRRTDAGAIAEVPVTTLPFVRLPYYHTPTFLIPLAANRVVGSWARMRRRNVSYTFHAVDFMEQVGDSLDPRIARHPGMTRPLNEKLRLADEAVALLGRRGSVVPLRELVREELAGAAS